MPSVLIAFIATLFIPDNDYGWGPCTVGISGPRILCPGQTITLTTNGSPGGGSCSWSTTPGLSPSGCSATLTGLNEGDLSVTVIYKKPYDFKCYETANIKVSNEDKDTDSTPACNDCNDNDPAVYPGAEELCDGKDNNCNDKIDDLCPGLAVPLFKQCDSRWGDDTYDNMTFTKLPDGKCKGCICSDGCALTAAVMVLRYYGVTTGTDGKEVNPKNLNEWLKNQRDGYIGPNRSVFNRF